VKSAVVVINPISGTGRAHPGGAAEVELAQRTLSASGYATRVVVTTGPGHATCAATEAVAAGAELVVSWGGDGTMNEVARALAFTSVALGLVPAGSGNGLARDLGLPMRPAAALAVAASNHRRRIGVGEANGRYFFNVAGVGLDARIARRFAEHSGRRGRLGYARVGIGEVLHYRARPYSLRWDGGAASPPALFIALANSTQYGNHGCIAPRARLDDGRLDLVVVEDQPLWRLLSRVPAFLTGRLRPQPGVRMATFTEATIEGGEGIEVHLDGEPQIVDRRLTVRVHPHGLEVAGPPPRR
jgi:diacylglycerol kinase (ATP)